MSLFDDGPAASALTLSELIAIEDTPELLAPQCPHTGIPVWPNIRTAFLRKIMADRLFASGSIDPPAERRSLRAVGALARAFTHNETAMLRGTLKSDLLINTESIGDQLRDDRWFNRYVDPFGDLSSGQAVVLTDMFDWTLNRPRHNERIFYHAPIQTSAALFGRVPGADAQGLARTVVTLACDRAAALLDWTMPTGNRAAFESWAARKVAALPFRYRAYRRLLRNVRPRLLLGSSHCYGIHAPLVAAARDLGVVTAEYQHGAISRGHDAYNFASAIFDNEAYRRTLPQYLLTYGTWWSAQVTAPVECIPIGYPAQAAKLDRLKDTNTSDRRTILVLSDGIEFDLYLNLARKLAEAAAPLGLTVTLRPHPLERTDVVKRYGGKIDGIYLDVSPDIYTSFLSAHGIISEMSTGLFEAVGLVERIVMLNTAKARFAYPEHPFATANSLEEAVALVVEGDTAKPKTDVEALWSENWREKYEAFLKERVGLHV